MNSFNCVCGSESKPCIVPSCFDKSTVNVEKALNQLVDSSWDDEDEDSDELLVCIK